MGFCISKGLSAPFGSVLCRIVGLHRRARAIVAWWRASVRPA